MGVWAPFRWECQKYNMTRTLQDFNTGRWNRIELCYLENSATTCCWVLRGSALTPLLGPSAGEEVKTWQPLPGEAGIQTLQQNFLSTDTSSVTSTSRTWASCGLHWLPEAAWPRRVQGHLIRVLWVFGGGRNGQPGHCPLSGCPMCVSVPICELESKLPLVTSGSGLLLQRLRTTTVGHRHIDCYLHIMW